MLHEHPFIDTPLGSGIGVCLMWKKI